MRFVLDRSVRFAGDGQTLIGGDPMRLMRLSPAGAEVMREWASAPQRAVDIDATQRSRMALIERLVDTGMAHRVVSADGASALDVVVIVPVFKRAEALDRCLHALRSSGVGSIVVCDDASPNGAELATIAISHGAEIVRRDTNGGPSAARMTGFNHAVANQRIGVQHDGLVAFVDSDIEVSPQWARDLVGHFEDPRVGLVAPRVVHRSVGVASVIDRYEMSNAPLDLGDSPAPIVAGTRVSYVPAAAVILRASALDAVGGFDEALSVGEDVDVVWRLGGGGWRCRYDPAAVVHHQGRSTLRQMLARRFDYGRSAAALDRRHPGSVPPVRINRWAVAIIAAVVVGKPVVAAGLWGVTARAMGRRLGAYSSLGLAVRVSAYGHSTAVRQVGRAAIRPWFPFAIVASALSKRMRRATIVGALIEPMLAWRRSSGGLDPLRFGALFLADDLAYSAGVWAGCVAEGRFGALAPQISSDP